jgi:adenylate cyclase
MIKKIIYTFGIGIFVAIFAAVLAYLNPLNSWHLKIADSLYTKNEPSDEIVIIGIDEVSISEEAGLGRFGSWSRAHYKEAIENLEEAGAKVIGLDLYLTEKQTSATKEYIKELIKNPEDIKNYSPAIDNPEDLELAETLSKYSNIVLAGNSELNDGKPLPIFINHNGEEVGFININPDEDTVARRTPIENGFDLKIAQKYSSEAIDTFQIPLKNNEMLINYFAEPYEYNSIPFVEVYRGNFDQERVAGKIALIGVTTQKIKDHFATPKDKKIEMPGVEIRANSIQTFLSGDYLQNQSQVSETITIIVLALIVALILSFLNIWLATAIILAITGGYYGYAHIMYGRGIILNMIYPFITIAVAYVATLAYKYFAELREKKYVKTAFGRYLSPNVMGEVLKNPDLLHLGGTNRNVTVFFSDIANFTTISEGMQPEDLISQINDYLSEMTEIIMELGGTLDKYVGDAIVAYFGAPLDLEDHAAKACEASLRMRERLPRLHEKWKAEGKPLADFRVGINTGYVVVGNVGCEKRFDYTVLGDEVNLGSRLEGANKKYETRVMISEATASALGSGFVIRELDLLRVKGKNKPVRVYELINRDYAALSGEGRELLERYNAGMKLYGERKFDEALAEFNAALEVYPEDGPSKLYRQRSEVLRDFPPAEDWDGVFEMKGK